MATLEGQTIANTYKSLLGISGSTAGGETLHATTLKVIQDGGGNASPIQLAKDRLTVRPAVANHANAFQVANQGGTQILNVASDTPAVSITGTLSVSSTLAVTGVISPTTHVDMPDSANIKLGTGDDLQLYHDGANSYITNSTGALKLATESSGIAVTIGHTTSEVTIADNLSVTGNADIDGTTNLDAVDIDGNVQLDGTLTVGVDDTGYDVKLFGATASAYLRWKQDSDDLILMGGARLGIGTDAPIGELHIKSTYASGNAPNVYLDYEDDLAGSEQGANIISRVKDSDNAHIDASTVLLDIGAQGWDYQASGYMGASTIRFLSSSVDNAWTNNEAHGEIRFMTAGGTTSATTTRLSIMDDGKIGIGTEAPAALLHVNQDVDGYFEALRLENYDNGSSATRGTDLVFRPYRGYTGGRIRCQRRANWASTSNRDSSLDFYSVSNETEALAMRVDYNGITTFTSGTTVTAGNSVLTDGDLVITAADHGIIHTNSGTVTQGDSITTAVTLNATSGIITMHATAITADENIEFTVNNSTVQADSVILLTMQDENTVDNTQLVCATHTIGGGSFKITVANTDSAQASSATAVKIHFLVINNS